MTEGDHDLEEEHRTLTRTRMTKRKTNLGEKEEEEEDDGGGG